jgi:bifunctional UDP-N-acetylglucosamine pyrophosphorylase/glucosamine-1-phosphate N-acetyltransferase
MTLSIVILAAGKGTRMNSQLPKVLQPLAGKPILQYVLDTSHSLQPNNISIVAGHKSEMLRELIKDKNISWRIQDAQLGTGHAVIQAIPDLKSDKTLILYGDVPLIKKADLQSLIKKSNTGLAVMTHIKNDANGYGRIIREDYEIQGIIEDKDCNEEQKKIKEINTGILAADTKYLKQWLSRLTNENAQKEYYLTDIVKFAVEDNITVSSHEAEEEVSISGVNSKSELAYIERGLQLNKAEELMDKGVTILDPSRIDIRGQLKCGQDVTIDVGCIFEGDVNLGNNVHIKPYSFIKNSDINESSIIEAFSHIDSSKVGPSCRVGPYARLRPGTVLENEVHIGNYVEIKNSLVDQGTKINHLSYIGDSEIGKNVNIGAGTITCNYDGVDKHKTIIEDDVFVGSNTQIIAPLKVGKGATIGAGSTITKDVPNNDLTLSRAQQKTISGWAKPVKK